MNHVRINDNAELLVHANLASSEARRQRAALDALPADRLYPVGARVVIYPVLHVTRDTPVDAPCYRGGTVVEVGAGLERVVLIDDLDGAPGDPSTRSVRTRLGEGLVWPNGWSPRA